MVKDKASILKERAIALARPLETEEVKEKLLLQVFVLGKETYGIDAHYIKEVLALKNVTKLPNVPQFVIGLMNVRRRIVSIIDLRYFFDLPVIKESDQYVIILENKDMEFGIVVDDIEKPIEIFKEDLESSLHLSLSGLRQESFMGLTKTGIIVLDGDKLMNSKSIILKEFVE